MIDDYGLYTFVAVCLCGIAAVIAMFFTIFRRH